MDRNVARNKAALSWYAINHVIDQLQIPPLLVPKLCTTIGIPPAMPNTNRPLPIVCPECHYDGCMLVVRSLTVIMVKCVSCRHEWATDFDNLTPEIQQKVDEVRQDH
jgi:hypothetical protein